MILTGYLHPSSLMLSLPSQPCDRCGELTIFIDLDFEVHLHDVCAAKEWQEYVEYIRTHPVAPTPEGDPF